MPARRFACIIPVEVLSVPLMASYSYPLWFLVSGAVLSLVTVVGNGLVVYLIITRKRLHNATNWIVLSLAIADFILGAGYLPTTKVQHHIILQTSPIRFRLPTKPSLSFFYMWDMIKYPYLNKWPFLTALRFFKLVFKTEPDINYGEPVTQHHQNDECGLGKAEKYSLDFMK